MKKQRYARGEMVSFILGGSWINGTIEYILEDDEYVVTPHPRYRIDGYYVLSSNCLKKLIENNDEG